MPKPHIHDGAGLYLIKLKSVHQALYGLLWSLGSPNEVHHLVDIVASHDESLEDVCTVLCFLQVELCAANGHVVAVLHKVMDTFLKC